MYISLPVNIHGIALGSLKIVRNMLPERVGQERRWGRLGLEEKVQGGFNLCFAVQNSWLKLGGPFLSFSQVGFENSPLVPKVLVGGAHQEPARCFNAILSLQKLLHYV